MTIGCREAARDSGLHLSPCPQRHARLDILIVLVLASTFLTDRVSVTATHPAFFGAVSSSSAGCAKRVGAEARDARAVALALLGALGTLRVVPALARGEFNRRSRARTVAMMVLMVIYVALVVNSSRPRGARGLARGGHSRPGTQIEMNGVTVGVSAVFTTTWPTPVTTV